MDRGILEFYTTKGLRACAQYAPSVSNMRARTFIRTHINIVKDERERTTF